MVVFGCIVSSQQIDAPRKKRCAQTVVYCGGWVVVRVQTIGAS